MFRLKCDEPNDMEVLVLVPERTFQIRIDSSYSLHSYLIDNIERSVVNAYCMFMFILKYA